MQDVCQSLKKREARFHTSEAGVVWGAKEVGH
jgi:hypothetical protein